MKRGTNKMKLIYFLLSILIYLNASIALAGKYKISQPGKADVYVPTYESDGKTLLVDSIVGPGTVPIGGLVAVMPSIQSTDAWQPPASGVIKDGFMRADGYTITAANVAAGCKLRGGTVLPNMTAKYLRGNTTSGSTGGANTQASSVAVATQPAFTTPAHYHGKGTFAIGSSGPHGHPIWTNYYGGDSYANMTGAIAATGGNWSVPTFGPSSSGNYAAGTANHSHGNGDFSGLVGNTGGSTGDSAISNTRSTDVSLTNNAVNNEPSYIETIWVIRVK
jgi:hypothetical protein